MLTVVWDCVVVHSENMEPTMQRCCVYIYIYIYMILREMKRSSTGFAGASAHGSCGAARAIVPVVA